MGTGSSRPAGTPAGAPRRKAFTSSSSWNCFCASSDVGGAASGGHAKGEQYASPDGSCRASRQAQHPQGTGTAVGTAAGPAGRVHNMQLQLQQHQQQYQQHQQRYLRAIGSALPPADSGHGPPNVLTPAEVLALAQRTIQQHFGGTEGATPAPVAAQQAVARLCSPPQHSSRGTRRGAPGTVGRAPRMLSGSSTTPTTTASQVLLPTLALGAAQEPTLAGCYSCDATAAHMLSRSSCSSAGVHLVMLPSSPPDNEPVSPHPRLVGAAPGCGAHTSGRPEQEHEHRKLMSTADEDEALITTCTTCVTAATSAVQCPASPCPHHDAAAVRLGGAVGKLASASSGPTTCTCKLNALIKAAGAGEGGRPGGGACKAGVLQAGGEVDRDSLPGPRDEEEEDDEGQHVREQVAVAPPLLDPVTVACVCLVHSQGRPAAGSAAAAGSASHGTILGGVSVAAARSAFASAFMGSAGANTHSRTSPTGPGSSSSSTSHAPGGAGGAAGHANPQIGLSQLPRSVVHWLACDLGYDAYGAPPATPRLLEPECSMYLCAAFCQVVGLMVSHAASQHQKRHRKAGRQPTPPLEPTASAAATAAAAATGADVWQSVQRALRHVVYGTTLEQIEQQQQQQQQRRQGQRVSSGDGGRQALHDCDTDGPESDGTDSDPERDEEEDEDEDEEELQLGGKPPAGLTLPHARRSRRARQQGAATPYLTAFTALRDASLVHQVTACTYALIASRAAPSGSTPSPFQPAHHHAFLPFQHPDALPPAAAGHVLRMLALKTATATDLLQRLADCVERRRVAQELQSQRGEEPLIMYVCGTGDTLTSVAAAAGVAVAAVVELNGLHTDPLLRPGDCLALPVASVLPRLHCTQPNESLCGVACQHAVTLSRLLGANPRLIGLNPRAASPGWMVEVPLLHGYE